MALLLLSGCHPMLCKITAGWLMLLAAAPLMTALVTNDRPSPLNRPAPAATRRAPSAPLTSSAENFAPAVASLTRAEHAKPSGGGELRRSLPAGTARPSPLAGLAQLFDPGATRSPILRL